LGKLLRAMVMTRPASKKTPAEAGYSGKPVAEKLGLKPTGTLALFSAPEGFEAALGAPSTARVLRDPKGALSLSVLFVTTRAEMRKRFAALTARTEQDGAVWIGWPKKSSGVATDVTEDAIREDLLRTGWVDVKVCALDATWSGLKLVLRKELRR